MLKCLSRFVQIETDLMILLGAFFWVSIGFAQETLKPRMPPNHLGMPRKIVSNVNLERMSAVSTLRSLASKIQTNQAEIVTYSGKWQCQDRHLVSKESAKKTGFEISESDPKDFVRFVRSKLTVAYQPDQGKMYCDFEVLSDELRPRGDGDAIQPIGKLAHQIAAVNGKEVFTLEPTMLIGDVSVSKFGDIEHPQHRSRVAYRDPIERAKLEEGSMIVNVLRVAISQREMHEEILMFAHLLEDNLVYTDESGELPPGIVGTKPEDWIRVSALNYEKGDRSTRVTVKNSQPGISEHVEFVFEFSDQVGGMPTEVRVVSGEITTHQYAWEYSCHENVYVPNKNVFWRSTSDGNRVLFQRILYEESGEVNKSIDNSAFELTALNLKKGERVVDRLGQQLLQVGDNGLVPYVRPDDSLMKKLGTEKGWRQLLLITNAACILLLVGLFVRGKVFTKRGKT